MYQKCIKLEITTILTDDKEVPWKYSDKKAAFFDYTEVKSAGQTRKYLFYCS